MPEQGSHRGLKVVHLSTYDISGGAARAAYRLHKGLRGSGHDSSILVAQRCGEDPSVSALKLPMDLASRLRRRFRRDLINHSFARYKRSRPAGYDIFSDDRSEHGATLVSQIPLCDVINLHWVSGFIDYQAFLAVLPQSVPIVWTLHDMNAFTGGCHYDHDCGKYMDGCGACPQLGSSAAADLSNQIWQRKRKVFEQIGPRRLHIVAPSRWLASASERSPLLSRFPISVIPNSIDTDDFAPRDRGFARDLLEVPQDGKIILFVANSVSDRRKGFALLTQALNSLYDLKNLFLISLGSNGLSIDAPIPHLQISPIYDDRWLSVIYSAADLFVIPSLQDNLPNTVLESMACGTPVVGFDTGGIPDMVRHGIDGLLVPNQDVDALRRAIIELFRDPARRFEMSVNCRRDAVEKYALEAQTRRYVELYKTITAH